LRPTKTLTIQAFGAAKSIDDWLADPVCRVSRGELLRRLKRKWSPERAITQPEKTVQPVKHPGRSEYRGVWWNKHQNRWEVCVSHEGERRHAGYFVDEVQAALAYDEKARALKGEDAVLNFPELA
jgi:hypothetical protein